MRIVTIEYDIKVTKNGPDDFSFELNEESARELKHLEEQVEPNPHQIPNITKKLADEYGKARDILKGQLYGKITEFEGKIRKKILV